MGQQATLEPSTFNPKSAIGLPCSWYRKFNTPLIRKNMCYPMHIQTEPSNLP